MDDCDSHSWTTEDEEYVEETPLQTRFLEAVRRGDRVQAVSLASFVERAALDEAMRICIRAELFMSGWERVDNNLDGVTHIPIIRHLRSLGARLDPTWRNEAHRQGHRHLADALR